MTSPARLVHSARLVHLAQLPHLARRFFGSLRPGGPSPAEVAWVSGHLSRSEFVIWDQMSDPDQRHSVEVARAVEAEVADRDRRDPNWSSLTAMELDSVEHRRQAMVAAALLHDSGKNAAGLATMARVGATVIRPLLDPNTIVRWASEDGVRQRLALYWRHPELGSAALEQARSHPLVVRWAAEHHLPSNRWTVAPELGEILSSCDND